MKIIKILLLISLAIFLVWFVSNTSERKENLAEEENNKLKCQQDCEDMDLKFRTYARKGCYCLEVFGFEPEGGRHVDYEYSEAQWEKIETLQIW